MKNWPDIESNHSEALTREIRSEILMRLPEADVISEEKNGRARGNFSRSKYVYRRVPERDHPWNVSLSRALMFP
jgi:hypothetical protein